MKVCTWKSKRLYLFCLTENGQFKMYIWIISRPTICRPRFLVTFSAGLTIVAIAMVPAILCVKFVLYYMQEWILELMPEAKCQKLGHIFCICCTEILFAGSKLNFRFVWEFASAWKSILYFKLFEVIDFKMFCLPEP